VIEETEAMNVVDVNSGKDTRKKPKPDEILRINKEAADKLMEQMRLRELSGMILVDFINMSSEEHREELLSYMKGRCKEDFNKVRIVDYTKLGLVEITREKKFPSLKQLLT
jgi:ribonuclease G